MSIIKYFRNDLIILAIGLVIGTLYGGINGLTVTAILILLEMSMSFDNAIVNSKYIEKLSPKWRKLFLTVGILIAVLGMRLIFPFLIVCLTGHMDPVHAWSLAMDRGNAETPGSYGYVLNHAHPLIAGFGGMFLLMLFLDFLFDEEKDSHWLSWIEKPLAHAGQFSAISTFTSLGALTSLVYTIVPSHDQLRVLTAGILGLLTYIATNGLATIMESKQESQEEKLSGIGSTMLLTGKAALSTFLFLEVLDASFSFDGVLGAFAITSDPIIIALGLGIGALFVRSLTLFLVEKGTLKEFEYLEHGAHWAIGALAIMLLITIRYEIPDYIIGLSGIAIIATSLITSLRQKDEIEENESHEVKETIGIYNSLDKD